MDAAVSPQSTPGAGSSRNWRLPQEKLFFFENWELFFENWGLFFGNWELFFENWELFFGNCAAYCDGGM